MVEPLFTHSFAESFKNTFFDFLITELKLNVLYTFNSYLMSNMVEYSNFKQSDWFCSCKRKIRLRSVSLPLNVY